MAGVLNPMKNIKAPLHGGQREPAKGGENDRAVKRGFFEEPAYQAVEKNK
jgi:hypothetical protein